MNQANGVKCVQGFDQTRWRAEITWTTERKFYNVKNYFKGVRYGRVYWIDVAQDTVL
jgi:hypothetical protein